MKRVQALSLMLAFIALCGPPVFGSRVLIGLRGGPLSPEAARSAMAGELSTVGGRIEYEYSLIDVVLVEVPEEALPKLWASPYVRFIERDGQVAAPRPLGEEGLKLTWEWLPWGVDRIDAEVVHHPPREQLALHHTCCDEKLPPWRERNEVRGIALITPIPAFPRQGGRGQRDSALALATLLLLPLLGLVGRSCRLRRPLLAALILMILGLSVTGCDLINIRIHPRTEGPEGQGVKVALLDSGIDPDHPDLEGNYRGGHDFVNHDQEPGDDNGHGTQVAGVLGARENGFGLIGVAPRAELFAVKVLGSDARGSISDVVKGLEWAIERGIQVVNMSLGTPEDSQALREAVRAAWEDGLVLIAPAGNESGRVLYPAAYPEVIAVSATDKNDRLAWFSNSGPQIELAAPGEEIPATYPGNRYRLATGTSFASPHVAGAAALLISSGVRDNREIRARLQETAEGLGLSPEEEGFGLVDAERAVLGMTSGDN